MITQKTLAQFFTYLENIDVNYKTLTVKENISDTEKIVASLACLIEEVGEVSTEVRKMTGLSFNQKKVDSFNMQDLEDEIVDVLITNLLLATSVGITNLDKAIARKIEKNNKRGY